MSGDEDQEETKRGSGAEGVTRENTPEKCPSPQGHLGFKRLLWLTLG